MSSEAQNAACLLVCGVAVIFGLTTCESKGTKTLVGQLSLSSDEPGTPSSLPVPPDRIANKPPPATSRPPTPSDSLSVEGLWVPSGWMGDGEAGVGALRRDVWTTNAASPPACERWEYRPRNGHLGWAAVAYQYPPNNWGDAAGKNLKNAGFTRLSLKVRGERSGDRVILSSGGKTKAEAAHPASYATDDTIITLTPEWTEVWLQLKDKDLSNTVTALTFAVNRDLSPDGCVFFVDDVRFTREPDGVPGRQPN